MNGYAAHDALLREVLGHLETSVSMITGRLRADALIEIVGPAEPPAIPYSEERLATARRIHAERRRMRLRAGDLSDLFSDPAWDILLDLYLRRCDGEDIGTSSACLAANVPPTTGLRWVVALQQRGLVKREPDHGDARRTLVRLTDAGRLLVERLLPNGQ